MSPYIELTKPRITLFILMSTAIGFLCGARAPSLDLAQLFHTLIGTALIASGTAALNQWYEREADAKMERTKARPIPSGRVSARHGVVVRRAVFRSWDSSSYGCGVNLLTALLGLFTLAQLSVRVHAAEAAFAALDHHRRDSRRDASADRLRRGQRPAELGSLEFSTPSCSCGSSRTFTPSPGCIAKTMRKAGIRMLPVVEPTANPRPAALCWFSLALIPISLLPKFIGDGRQFVPVSARWRWACISFTPECAPPLDRTASAGAPGAAGERRLSSFALWPPGPGRHSLLARSCALVRLRRAAPSLPCLLMPWSRISP